MATSNSPPKKTGRVLCHIGELGEENDCKCCNDRTSITTLDQCRKATPYYFGDKNVTEGELIASRALGIFDLEEYVNLNLHVSLFNIYAFQLVGNNSLCFTSRSVLSQMEQKPKKQMLEL